MTERSIEIGGLRIQLTTDEDPVSLVQSLMRHVSNQEVADILGVSERTVRRWKRTGRLPQQEHTRLKLVDVIAHLTQTAVQGAEARTDAPENESGNGNRGAARRRRVRAPASVI